MASFKNRAEVAAKRVYVWLLRRLAWLSTKTGLQRWLESSPTKGGLRDWFASLLVIYDIDGLIRLDVPWWTYQAIAEVDAFLASAPRRVFEYGSGASTVWLARRAAAVTSVEHDAEWYQLVQSRVSSLPGLCPVDLRHIAATPDPDGRGEYRSDKAVAQSLDFADYAKSIESAAPPFDLIVIDGRVRAACLRHAVSCLAPDGMIVFDNSPKLGIS